MIPSVLILSAFGEAVGVLCRCALGDGRTWTHTMLTDVINFNDSQHWNASLVDALSVAQVMILA